jgi:hypothetical protein
MIAACDAECWGGCWGQVDGPGLFRGARFVRVIEYEVPGRVRFTRTVRIIRRAPAPALPFP